MNATEQKKEYASPKLSTFGSVEELTGQKTHKLFKMGYNKQRPNRGNGDPDAPFGS